MVAKTANSKKPAAKAATARMREERRCRCGPITARGAVRPRVAEARGAEKRRRAAAVAGQEQGRAPARRYDIRRIPRAVPEPAGRVRNPGAGCRWTCDPAPNR